MSCVCAELLHVHWITQLLHSHRTLVDGYCVCKDGAIRDVASLIEIKYYTDEQFESGNN